MSACRDARDALRRGDADRQPRRHDARGPSRRCATAIASLAEDTRRTRQLLTHLGIAGKPRGAARCARERGATCRASSSARGGRARRARDRRGHAVVSDPGERARRRRRWPRACASCPSRARARCWRRSWRAAWRATGAFGSSGSCRGRSASGARRSRWSRRRPSPVVLFEAPNRVAATLRDLADATPDARRVRRARAHQAARGDRARHVRVARRDEREWLGEIVLVLGAHEPDAREARSTTPRSTRASTRRSRRASTPNGRRTARGVERTARREVYERVVRRKKRRARAGAALPLPFVERAAVPSRVPVEREKTCAQMLRETLEVTTRSLHQTPPSL